MYKILGECGVEVTPLRVGMAGVKKVLPQELSPILRQHLLHTRHAIAQRRHLRESIPDNR